MFLPPLSPFHAHSLCFFHAPGFRLTLANSLALFPFRPLGQRPVHPVRLDRGPSRVLGLVVHVSEHELQVLAVAFAVADGEDADGELEDIKLYDAGARVLK